MDSIRIDGLELRCIVGLRSYERRHEQPLRLDLHLGLDASTAGRSGRIGDTIDYSRVADEVTALLQYVPLLRLEVARWLVHRSIVSATSYGCVSGGFATAVKVPS